MGCIVPLVGGILIGSKFEHECNPAEACPVTTYPARVRGGDDARGACGFDRAVPQLGASRVRRFKSQR